MNIAILLIALVSSEKVYFILTTKKSFGAKRHTVKVILVFKWAELWKVNEAVNCNRRKGSVIFKPICRPLRCH